MRIGIDARLWGSSGRGVGRYVQNLVENLEKVDSKNKYFIFLREKGFNTFLPHGENFHKVLADVPWYGVQEQVVMPGIFSASNLDLLHVPHFNAPLLYGERMVVTIHDLTMLKFGGRETSTLPAPLFYAKRLGLRVVTELAVRRAARVIVPSKFVKKELVRTFTLPPGKIVVTPEAGVLAGKERTAAEREIEDVLGKYRITKPYFLYVGSFYPHKNVGRLVEAVKVLNERLKKSAQLVLVGGKDAFLERVAHQALEIGALKYLVLTGYVTDADLVDLYREAEAYVQPSLSEGFGLGSVEAMALGVPVVQSEASCLPEIAGEAALYFDPQNPRDIAEKLAKVLGNKTLRQGLVKKGLARAKDFSWEKMARETLGVYRKAAR